METVVMVKDTDSTAMSVYLPVIQDGRTAQAARQRARRVSLERQLFLPTVR